MGNKRGYTLAELMFTCAILGIMFGAIFITKCEGPEVQHDAENEVRIYARKLNLPIDGIACGSIANRHGLVSCTLRSGNTIHQLECIGTYSRGHGCRDPKLSIPQPGDVQQ